MAKWPSRWPNAPPRPCRPEGGRQRGAAQPLRANAKLATGVILVRCGLYRFTGRSSAIGAMPRPLRPYRNGRDRPTTPRGVLVIDAFGLSAEQLREQIPPRPTSGCWSGQTRARYKTTGRDSKSLVAFGRNQSKTCKQLVWPARYIATVETSKHRVSSFGCHHPAGQQIWWPSPWTTPTAWASSPANCPHGLWQHGGCAGRPSGFIKTRCFDTFPSPTKTPASRPHCANALPPWLSTSTRAPQTRAGLAGTAGGDFASAARMSAPA